jgi:hypothetical protein
MSTAASARGGLHRARNGAEPAVTGFTHAGLERGSVVFKHDGSNTAAASINVVVADHTGATSGAPQAV